MYKLHISNEGKIKCFLSGGESSVTIEFVEFRSVFEKPCFYEIIKKWRMLIYY